MDISFNIIVYTQARNLKEYLSLQNKAPQKIETKKSENRLVLATIGKVGGFLIILFCIVLLILGISQIYIVPENISIGIFLALAVIYFLYITISKIYDKEEPLKSFENFGEKIHFSNYGIKISSPIKERNLNFLYSEITHFDFCIKPEIVIFRWKSTKGTYQYSTSSNYTSYTFIYVLQHLYAQNVPVREIDELGRKLHLLELVDKPMPKIDDKYQRLIDEIGEKE